MDGGSLGASRGTGMDGINSLRNGPDENGRFGLYGGRFVAETLMPLILDLEQHYRAAKFDLPCTIFMGATDVERQRPNVLRMKMLGAEVRPVTAGAGTLKDAMNEALRDWVTNVDTTYYLIGTAAGPHPYPEM